MEVVEIKKSSIYRKSSRKPPAIKNEIIARRIAGQNKASIAKDLGIAAHTVTSIIELTNIDRMLEDGRLGAMKRVPKALDVLDIRLEKNSESAAIWLLDKCFEEGKPSGKKMTGDLTLNQTLNVLLHGDKPDEKVIEQAAAPIESPDKQTT